MSFTNSSRFTRFATSAGCVAALSVACQAVGVSSFEYIVRDAARTNGFVPFEQTHVSVDSDLAAAGKTLFESKFLSLNGDISCQNCHLDEFASADGIPNAVAIGGEGMGAARVASGGAILPRNTLPLWGRGGAGFSVFFWDGKVDFAGDRRVSQFGDAYPSEDSLVTAVHLPPVEIREMLDEDETVLSSKTESVAAARDVYKALVTQLRDREPATMSSIALALSIPLTDVSFSHVATAVASFIRDEFRVRETRFHRFVFDGDTLTEEELRGARLFYGKGKCSNCHSGAYFTDFQFHAVPFPQSGFGKNGFGVDYGRFNVTHDPGDLYKFRTPPLFNVENTAPYGYSGSVASLQSAIVFHFDPLRGVDPGRMTAFDRHEYFKRLATSAQSKLLSGYLDDEEVDSLVAFLRTLTFLPGT